MKNIKTYLTLLLSSAASMLYAVTLPQAPFGGGYDLYDENHDYVQYSVGTEIRNINVIISTVNDSWGESCLETSFGDKSKCADCCGDTWVLEGERDEDEIKYDRCLEICKEGTSLPLGSTLWLLPFVLVYAAFKRYRTNKQEVID